MLKENIKKATEGENYEILEIYNLTYVYGEIAIFVDVLGQFYIGMEGEYDRGGAFFEYWSIKREDYEAFKKPNLVSFKKLLSRKFFEKTLFDVFLKREENQQLINHILVEPELPKIENTTIKIWFQKKRKTLLDSKVFEASKSFGDFELPGLVHASQFRNDNELELDVLFSAAEDQEYQIQKYVLKIKEGDLIEGKIVAVRDGLPFFSFAKDYPIQSVTFGMHREFSAKIIEAKGNDEQQKVVILKGAEKLYQYEYPKEANLGRFWVFRNKTTSSTFLNSVLFMYSIRNNGLEESYFILRFEVKGNIVIPKTKVLAYSDTIISFSPNGRMVYSLAREEGRRSKFIQVVQL